MDIGDRTIEVEVLIGPPEGRWATDLIRYGIYAMGMTVVS